MDTMIFATKKERVEYVRGQLASNPKWAIRALEVIYQAQTIHEQTAHTTVEANGVGFSAFDAEILTSFAKQVINWRSNPRYPTPLSEKQMALVFKRIPKYAAQIIAHTSIGDKLKVA